MSVKKIGKYYHVRFMYNGTPIRFSTKQGDKQTAKDKEGEMRTRLSREESGLNPRQYPKLKDFLEKDFLTHVETKFKNKPNTVRSYKVALNGLLSSDIFDGLRLNEVNDSHAEAFIRANQGLEVNTINLRLATLRRALKLAIKWGKLDAYKQISLAPGGKKGNRILSQVEQAKYLAVASPTLRDISIIFLGTGMRPGEIFAMRWENIDLWGSDSVIDITTGKTVNAERRLFMMKRVYDTLRSRWQAAGKPETGWVFPTHSGIGHIVTIAHAHKTAVRKAGIQPCKPYSMRHTALTELAALGVSPFTIQKIAGHASIVTTQRYVHPQDDAVREAFSLRDEKSGQENGQVGKNGISIAYAKQA